MGEVSEYQEFFAVCDHMPGSPRELRVGGTVVLTSGSASAELRAHDRENPGINPRQLELDLVITPPAGAGTTDMNPFPLDPYVIEDPEFEYQTVYFHVVGTDDEPPPSIEVQHPE